MAVYNSTITNIRNNTEDIRDVLNDNSLDGNDNMSTWHKQIDEALNKNDKLRKNIDELTESNKDFSEKYTELYSEDETLASENDTLKSTNDIIKEKNTKIESENNKSEEQLNNIYNSIVNKGGSPSKDDPSTYPESIESLDTIPEYNIEDAAYLFTGRDNLINILLKHCKKTLGWSLAFYDCTIPSEINIDLTYAINVTQMFNSATGLEKIHTKGSFGGDSVEFANKSLTLDLSKFNEFDTLSFLQELKPNESGQERIIKVHDNSIFEFNYQEIIKLASEKNYIVAPDSSN